MTGRTGEPELRATKIELLAGVLRRCMGIDDGDNARHDFGDINGGSLQRPTEVAAELLDALSDENLTIAALTPSQPVPSGLDELREAAQAVLVELDIIRRHWNTTSKAMIVHRDTQEALRSALEESNR